MQPTATLSDTSTNKGILNLYGESERLCREKERRVITSLSRSQAWELERKGLFPQRKKIGRTNVWLLSDLLMWAHQLQGAQQHDQL